MHDEVINALEDGFKDVNEKWNTKFKELDARMLDIEQKGVPSQVIASMGAGPSLGREAVKSLSSEPTMAAAMAAAKRQNKVSMFSARSSVDVSVKSILVNLGNGGSSSEGNSEYATPPDRNPNIALPGLRSLRLLDVLPRRPTTSDSFEFVHLNVTGDASEQEFEGDEKAELDFEGELVTGNVATIAAWTTASRQVLSDNASLAVAIDTLVGHKVLARLEHRLINGLGGQGKIDGLISLGTAMSPSIATAPAEVVGESMIRQADAGYMPNLILLNPLDWYEIQITRATADGQYLFGSPTLPVPPSLWNAPIVRSPSVPRGTGLTIDTRFTTLMDREQMSVMVSNSHKDYFTRNLVAILGELRAGLEVLDANAVYHFGLDPVSSGP